MRERVDRSAVIRLFEDIRNAFPRLSMRLDEKPSQVDLNMDIPRQPGLDFDVNLNLQGDELHLSAGAFWLEFQKPHEGDWQTIGTWHGWAWPLPRRTVVRVLRNVTDAGSGQ